MKESNMTEKEMAERICELEKIKNKCQNELRKLYREQAENQQAKLHKLVGRCYKGDDKIFIIKDVPKMDFMMTGEFFFNPYNIPALIIQTEEMTGNNKGGGYLIYVGTIHSIAADFEDPVAHIQEEYKEISAEEVRSICYKTMDNIVDFYAIRENKE